MGQERPISTVFRAKVKRSKPHFYATPAATRWVSSECHLPRNHNTALERPESAGNPGWPRGKVMGGGSGGKEKGTMPQAARVRSGWGALKDKAK